MKLNVPNGFLVVTGISLALWSCEQSATSNDFLVSGEYIQEVSLADIDEIIVRCYCNEAVKFKATQTEKAELKITGTYSSFGYHGDQEKPVSISDQLLAFKETRDGTTLVLESQEYTYIHHALLIEKLEIQMPGKIDFQLDVLNYEELEGRKVK